MRTILLACLAVLLAGAAHAEPQSKPAQAWLLGDWGGYRTKLFDWGVDLQVSYVNEIAYNAQGGVRNLVDYTDQVAVGATFDLERLFGLSSKNRVIFLLGEASYIIYLVHPYIIFTVLRVVARGAAAWSSPALAVLIVALLALVSAISIAIHVWFEKPVMAFLRARLT